MADCELHRGSVTSRPEDCSRAAFGGKPETDWLPLMVVVAVALGQEAYKTGVKNKEEGW